MLDLTALWNYYGSIYVPCSIYHLRNYVEIVGYVSCILEGWDVKL